MSDGASGSCKILGCLIRVDDGKEFDVWSSHISRSVKIAKVVDRIHRTEYIIADDHVTGGSHS